MKMNKRIITFAAALLLSAALSGCGKNEPQTSIISEKETTAASTEAVTGESTESTTKKKSSGTGLGFGMMGYVKKSKQSSINADASSLYKSVCCVLVDEQQKITCDTVYSNTDENDEINKTSREQYYTPLEPLDYIMGIDKNGQPEWIVCSRNTSKNRYVGVFGNVENADELRDMKWADVLAHFGFNEKEYTDIPLEKDESMNNAVQERTTLDLNDKNVSDPCMLAEGIAYVLYNSYDSELKDCYGIWPKDKPFTDVPEEDIPEHGDIEYIVLTDACGISNVFCWDCDRDKSYVGDSYFGFGYEKVVGLNWDVVLEKYNYKQGEYTIK